MDFLIITEPDDYHALLVKRGLEEIEQGHQVRLLFPADHPTLQKNAVFIDKHRYQWICSDSCSSISDNHYDVVWWRRVRKPYIPRNLVHPEDYSIVVKENILFYEALSCNLAPDAWWVNPVDAARKAGLKLLQLKIASECGMNIPSTLCANDPQKIHDFVCSHEDNGVIYKPLSTHLWCEAEKQVKMVFTSKIKADDLPNDALLQYTPGLYQKEIKKIYELRVTCFGDTIVAAKLNSQKHPKGKIDWRLIPDGELSVEPYQLPEQLEVKIRLFMSKMNLVFGALDFIVSEENEYVFLEVNEQGQFLWLEDYNPDFRMLDIFIQFLIHQSANFIWDPKKAKHRMADYLDEVHQIAESNQQNHHLWYLTPPTQCNE